MKASAKGEHGLSARKGRSQQTKPFRTNSVLRTGRIFRYQIYKVNRKKQRSPSAFFVALHIVLVLLLGGSACSLIWAFGEAPGLLARGGVPAPSLVEAAGFSVREDCPRFCVFSLFCAHSLKKGRTNRAAREQFGRDDLSAFKEIARRRGESPAGGQRTLRADVMRGSSPERPQMRDGLWKDVSRVR